MRKEKEKGKDKNKEKSVGITKEDLPAESPSKQEKEFERSVQEKYRGQYKGV